MDTTSRQVSPIERYCCDLTELARQGRLQQLGGHEAHLARVFEILVRWHQPRSASKYNRAIVGTDDDEGWPLVAEVVRRIASGSAPDMLRDLRIVALEWEALISAVNVGEVYSLHFAPREPAVNRLKGNDFALHFREHFERVQANPIFQRLEALFGSLGEARVRTVLYVPYLHRLVAGEVHQYPIDAFDLLKPALGRGEIRIIGTCSLDNYRACIQPDASLQRRFQEVCTPQRMKRKRW